MLVFPLPQEPYSPIRVDQFFGAFRIVLCIALAIFVAPSKSSVGEVMGASWPPVIERSVVNFLEK